MSTTFTKAAVCKVNDELGLVFGYAIICKVGGEDFFDAQDDHIPEDAMLEAASDFMQKSRIAGDMHAKGEDKKVIQKGTVVFAWPMTTEIAAAMDISVEKTGLMIAIRPNDPDILAKFRDGTYTGFSIGGKRILDEDV